MFELKAVTLKHEPQNKYMPRCSVKFMQMRVPEELLLYPHGSRSSATDAVLALNGKIFSNPPIFSTVHPFSGAMTGTAVSGCGLFGQELRLTFALRGGRWKGELSSNKNVEWG
jgi:hypothetical protein